MLRLVILLAFLSQNGSARKYDRCELARELVIRHSVPEDVVGEWLCLASYGSAFETNTKTPQQDGTTNFGIFQINSGRWCSEVQTQGGNACMMKCSIFLNDNIADDAICLNRIRLVTGGFATAFPNYSVNCPPILVQSMTTGCDLKRYI